MEKANSSRFSRTCYNLENLRLVSGESDDIFTEQGNKLEELEEETENSINILI